MNRIRKPSGDGSGSSGRGGAGDGVGGGDDDVPGGDVWPPGGPGAPGDHRPPGVTRLRVVGGRAETPDIPPPIRAVIDPHDYRVEVLFSVLTDEQWRLLPRGGIRLDYMYHEPTGLHVRLEERRISD